MTGHREKRKLATRRAIVRAGLALFAEEGYTRTTLAMIATKADVSLRTVSVYFPHKIDIAVAPLDAILERLHHHLEATTGDAFEALESFLKGEVQIEDETGDDLVRRALADNPVLRVRQEEKLFEGADWLARRIARDSNLTEPGTRERLLATASLAMILELWSGRHLADQAQDIPAAIALLRAAALQE
ncbi:TetR/AcrR family transcriptional regulator [Psychromicrobium xiongbiense]|uniref:TetR/AcrR family transcriptional regulator n=1 Tax=Psychromicrobium xiongbiense TaxID=3051184 RepID=UPI002553660E|nr:TetR/AcrR family transcriptional regulator [Psychromicrobium sp. YIM S02556]